VGLSPGSSKDVELFWTNWLHITFTTSKQYERHYPRG
jgi:hypothetical protein